MAVLRKLKFEAIYTMHQFSINYFYLVTILLEKYEFNHDDIIAKPKKFYQ